MKPEPLHFQGKNEIHVARRAEIAWWPIVIFPRQPSRRGVSLGNYVIQARCGALTTLAHGMVVMRTVPGDPERWEQRPVDCADCAGAQL